MPSSFRSNSEIWEEEDTAGRGKKRKHSDDNEMNFVRRLLNKFTFWREAQLPSPDEEMKSAVESDTPPVARIMSTPRSERDKEDRRQRCQQSWFQIEERIKYGQLLSQFTREEEKERRRRLLSNHATTMTESQDVQTVELLDDSPMEVNVRTQATSTVNCELSVEIEPSGESVLRVSQEVEKENQKPLIMPPSIVFYQEAIVKNGKFLSKDWLRTLRDGGETSSERKEEKRIKDEERLTQLKEKRKQATERFHQVVQRRDHLPEVKFSYLSSFHLRKDFFEEPSEKRPSEEDELPEITAEMETLIADAFDVNAGNEEEVLIKEVRRKDIQTLRGLNWLNDEIINEYFTLIEQQRESCKCLSTFFFKSLTKSGFKGVKRWTKKFDLFSFSLVLIPVHLSLHWTLIAIDFKLNTITFYDSMCPASPSSSSQYHQSVTSYLELISSYLEDEHKDKKGAPLNRKLKLERPADIPQQLNGSDCGMFCCKYADYLARRRKFNFDQSNMPYFRRRMVFEIITQKLL